MIQSAEPPTACLDQSLECACRCTVLLQEFRRRRHNRSHLPYPPGPATLIDQPPIAPNDPPAHPVTGLVIRRGSGFDPSIGVRSNRQGRGRGFFAAPANGYHESPVFRTTSQSRGRCDLPALPGKVRMTSRSTISAIVRRRQAPCLPQPRAAWEATKVRRGQDVIAIGLAPRPCFRQRHARLHHAVRRADRTLMLQTDGRSPRAQRRTAAESQREFVGINTIKSPAPRGPEIAGPRSIHRAACWAAACTHTQLGAFGRSQPAAAPAFAAHIVTRWPRGRRRAMPRVCRKARRASFAARSYWDRMRTTGPCAVAPDTTGNGCLVGRPRIAEARFVLRIGRQRARGSPRGANAIAAGGAPKRRGRASCYPERGTA